MPTGSNVFTTPEGVNYLIEKYLTSEDIDFLQKYNTQHSYGRFKEELIRRLERGSNNSGWIPGNYEDELVENASAQIGTNRTRRSTKNGKEVDVYETGSGKEVYESGTRLKDFRTGRYVRTGVFEE